MSRAYRHKPLYGYGAMQAAGGAGDHKPAAGGVLIAEDATGVNIASTVDLATAVDSRTSESGHDWARLSGAAQRLQADSVDDTIRNFAADADAAWRQYVLDLSAEVRPKQIKAKFLHTTTPVKGATVGGGLCWRATDGNNCIVAELTVTQGNNDYTVTITEYDGGAADVKGTHTVVDAVNSDLLTAYKANPFTFTENAAGNQFTFDCTELLAGLTVTSSVFAPKSSSKNCGLYTFSNEAENMEWKEIQVYS